MHDCGDIQDFNSHAHVERDRIRRLLYGRAQNFNSHAHVERDRIRRLLYGRAQNFNSHAHVERDRIILHCTLPQRISTHTLTWSVTGTYYTFSANLAISTHTLTWSVTRCICMMNEFYAFQLTRSRGA